MVIIDTSDLPPGHRFTPRKQELIEFYLSKKTNGETLPEYPKILDRDIYKHHPLQLLKLTREERCVQAGEDDTEAYFFTQLKKPRKSVGRRTRVSRSVASGGTWKEHYAKDVKIYDLNTNEKRVVGIYKYFKFKPAKDADDEIEWQMHEYSLQDNNDIVLCHILVKGSEKLDKQGKKKKRSLDKMSTSGQECGSSKRRRVDDRLVSSLKSDEDGAEEIGVEVKAKDLVVSSGQSVNEKE